MQRIIKKLHHGGADSACQHIIDTYNSRWKACINYVYWAQIVKYNLFDDQSQSDYKTCVNNSDLLLPDGIALKTWRRVARLLWYHHYPLLHNLNGTDFLPYFLQYCEKLWFDIVLYWWYTQDQKAIKEYCTKITPLRIVAQYEWYTDLVLPHKKNCILIQSRWWVQEYRCNTHDYDGYIVFNQWWTFDFWAGKNTRSPKRASSWLWKKFWDILSQRWAEAVWRLIDDPKKNTMKFFSWFQIIIDICQLFIWKFAKKT